MSKELEVVMLLSEVNASLTFTVTTDQLDLDPEDTRDLGLVHKAIYKFFRATPLDIEDVHCEEDYLEDGEKYDEDL